MHLNKERYGVELYNLLECLNFDTTAKGPVIEKVLEWAQRYIDYSCVAVCTLENTALPSIEFYYEKNVPEHWLKEYHRNDYAKDDPVIQYALNIGGVFSWRDALVSFDTPRGREVIARGERYGLRHGYTYFMPDAEAQPLAPKLVSLANVSSKSDVKCEYIIATLGATLCYLAENVITQKELCKAPLNDSELQVLDWSAKGKSIWEIAKIIDTPERTVKYHLLNTYRKLEASNKTQAVSNALKLGLLH
ncbi:autoinducer binding domain-containing protein [Pseudomonas fluorescens]|uniref:helix-turn-helix transcriptional regulator n=1 Tax=Pseudomonas TaxID=286 RepID=UPI00025E89AE|nr:MULTISPECIES: LuxR family transcriptional regulator [Pseudomonas]AFJ56005.1 autoinducer-binding transcriptional regulator, LuxR family [Pseudomonas fluorescens A506]MBD8256532.1 autoinducer binding domain-containing protein [Pseudomonas fluorescens]PMZ72451.1 LuxR family transcriptional regulator [Pseudomonas sp. GW247-3R2A]EPJ83047.1 regulatory protein, LuxR [Pseudomonas sp. CFT9]MBH3400081.1 autoinducer binding domain-containing protein [Pseudomonas fluorescens]